MKAEVIAVGSELLTPLHLDTNSLFITERLSAIGIALQGKAVAGDDRAALKAIMRDALGRADLLVVTGGLGPTGDDLTREVVADLIGRPLEYREEIFAIIEGRFASRGIKAPEINKRQAMVPRGAVVLPNGNGTAPGLWIEHDGKIVVLLPGPSREMKPMFDAVIRERLTALAGETRFFRRLLRVTGQSESHVEEKMQPLYARWLSSPLRIDTTILASPGQIELHLVTETTSAEDAHRVLDAAVADVESALGMDLFSTAGETLPEVIGALCKTKGLRISAAESCTGGMFLSRLTDVAGSSEYVERGVVVYSNKAKVELLGIPAALIATHGAVSEPVAEAMAAGMVRSGATDLAVGITGIAGPSGATPDKPVGTVAIAAAWKRGDRVETRVRTYRFLGGRDLVRFQASQAAMDMLRRWLLAPDA